jgi:hypothetical protein
MKRLIIILFLPILFGCATISAEVVSADNHLQTSASGKLITDIKRDLEVDHNTFYPECMFSKVLSAAPLSKDEDGTYELWTIEACSGKQFTYKVMIMYLNGANGVGIFPMDSNESEIKP